MFSLKEIPTIKVQEKKNSHLDRHFNIQIADPITPTTVTFMVTLWEYSSRWVPSCANVTQKLKKK